MRPTGKFVYSSDSDYVLLPPDLKAFFTHIRMLHCGSRKESAEDSEMENYASRNGWSSPRWQGITRTYTHEQVDCLRGTVHVEYSLARAGAEKLWRLLHREPYVAALGALTGNQAIQMAAAGLKAIYLSGWQVEVLIS